MDEGNRRAVLRGTTGGKRGNFFERAGLSGVGPRERPTSLLSTRKAAVCRVAICKPCYAQRRKNRHRYNLLLNQLQSRSRPANTGRLRSLLSLLALRARNGLAPGRERIFIYLFDITTQQLACIRRKQMDGAIRS